MYVKACMMVKIYLSPGTSDVKLKNNVKKKRTKQKTFYVCISCMHTFIAQEVRKSRKYKNKQEMSTRGRGQNKKICNNYCFAIIMR